MPADQTKPFILKSVPRPPAIELAKHVQLVVGRKFNRVLRFDSSADDMKRSATLAIRNETDCRVGQNLMRVDRALRRAMRILR